MERPYYAIARIDDHVSPRRRQANVDDDVVGDAERVAHFVRGGVDDVQPSLVRACNDVSARRSEEGHGGRLLGILRCLLLGCIVAFELRATGRRGEGVFDGDLGGDVDDDGLVFEEGSHEEHAETN